MRKATIVLLVALLLPACEQNSNENSATTPQTQEPPTTIKVLTAREFIEGFKEAGLPVGKVVCFTDETDPNNLLGRPGGYVEKCDWQDKRYIDPLTTSTDPLDKELQKNTEKDQDLIGGSIETFEKPGGAAERAAYLHGFEGPSALSPGYTFQPKDANWVLRVDQELTKSQAQAYLRAFLAQL